MKRLLAFRMRQSENLLRGLILLTALPDGRSGRVWQVPKSINEGLSNMADYAHNSHKRHSRSGHKSASCQADGGGGKVYQ